ncbi:MAG: dTMP kinase [Mariprofundales bacterium]
MFISFEGIDGVGKSTQLRQTALWLQQNQGIDVLCTYEPGDTPLGKEIRRILLSGEHIPIPRCELLLFLADRAQHVKTCIQPARQRGQWVLCDRYTDSTRAYQLAARNILTHNDDNLDTNNKTLETLLSFAELGMQADMTLWLDADVNTAQQRLKKRSQQDADKLTRLDNEVISFHERVRQAFQQLYKKYPKRIYRIDACQEPDNIQQQIHKILLTLMR